MGKKMLVKGTEVLGESAIRAGCRYFFGYPITPQNEIPEYLSRRLPEVGGVYLQGESEVASINMVFGAAAAGARVMTTSSSPGISLMQEGISYIAGAELPCVIINVMRGGPGLGGILPAQADYFQATRGGGHGDYRVLVLAPSTLQEAVDIVQLAFDLADKYRNPVMVLVDGFLGQMMEPVDFGEYKPLESLPPKEWALTGAKGRPSNVVHSLNIDPDGLEEVNNKLQEKYRRMAREEIRYELWHTEDASILIAAYGTTARIAKTAILNLREKGIKVGLFRPISLFPYPYKVLRELSDKIDRILVVEMSKGQMVEDVKLGVGDKSKVYFYGKCGGNPPTFEEISAQIMDILNDKVGVWGW